ncbi:MULTISPECIES: DUF397 domain-containing protein [Nocardiopsis]|uniref:DUF397 domain-containing protein n=1 Tax=Nocardiopsis TaxID=2013 RepID=UPI0008FCCFBF|nr:DUF397 domain-containing protein [Nocardiopsis dassonvillei]
MDTESPRWFKSSYSAAATCCVETVVTTSGVGVRDSVHADGRTLWLAAPEWTALLRVVSGS